MKHEHALNSSFTANRGMKNETRIGVRQAKNGCAGCMFRKPVYNYMMGRYGFSGNYDCLAAGAKYAKCKADFRSDNTDIIYVKLIPLYK